MARRRRSVMKYWKRLAKPKIGEPEKMRWFPIESSPPDVLVMTKIDDEHGVRNEQSMIRKGNLWYTSEGGMYVYYTPTHWSWGDNFLGRFLGRIK